MAGAFSKFGRGEVKPVEIAGKLRRELDDRAAVMGRDRTVVPNQFVVELAPDDLAQIESWGASAMAAEFAGDLTAYAASQHYAFLGPVAVSFESNQALTPGRIQVRSASLQGAAAPATTAPSVRHPMIDVAGQRYLLTGPVTVIGRDAEADIQVDDPGVSRRHLEIRVLPEGVVATDLNSTNGLFVEGHQVPAATLLDGNTLTIGRTRIVFWQGSSTTESW